MVTHVCNLSFSGGREYNFDSSSGKGTGETLSQKQQQQQQQKWTRGMAHAVESLVARASS
jgi:hypothetical protein